MAELYILAAAFALAHAVNSLRNGNWVALPLVVLSAETLAAATFWLSGYQTKFAQFWSRAGSIENGAQNVTYFSLIYMAFLAVYLLECRRAAYIYVKNLKAPPREKNRSSLSAAPVVVFLFAAYHFHILDKSIIYNSSEYLLMSSANAVNEKTHFNLFIQSSHKLVGIISLFLLGSAIVRRRYFDAIVLALPSLWFYLFQIGAHSRLSAVNAASFAFPFLYSDKRVHKNIGIFLIVISALNLLSSLSGRGSNIQGFASISNYFNDALATSPTAFLEVLGNIFEGAFVQAEGFYYNEHQYATRYKITALSPLPSFLDGYADLIKWDQIRLHKYVPMSATTEVRLFGPGFLFFYFLIAAYSYSRIFHFFRRQNRIAFTASLIIFTLACYLQFTYPTRNVFRFFYLVIFIYFIDIIISSIVAHGQKKIKAHRHSRTHVYEDTNL